MTPVDDRLRAAAWYAQHGFAILPLWSTLPDGTCRCPKGRACEQKPGKHPYTEPDRLHGFRDATTDTDKITTFMGAETHPNWGYVPRAGEFGWDLDGEGWREKLAALEEQFGPLPETLGTRTPNDGEHRVFRWPVDVERPRGELLGFVARWGSGRGQGYLVGPRSAINGRVYEPNGTLEVADLPRSWAIAALIAATERVRQTFSDVPVGNRHNVLRDTSRFLHGRGLEGEALEVAIDAINAALPEPKTAEEVRRAIGDVDQFPVDRDVATSQQPDPQAPEKWWIGSRTAADLPSGAPPPQLVPPFLDPDGPTVIYGKGGAGKGIATCWLIKRLVALGQIVMIIDYEGHDREWGTRLRGLGMTLDELRKVHYRAPYGNDWHMRTGALSEVADDIRADVDMWRVTYVVIDSYSPATSNGDTMGGEAAAREYFGALVKIGRPSLTIGHVRGDAEKFPERPFGSVFVHNYARETWALHSEADADNDPDDPTRPIRMTIELRNPKKSGGSRARPQFLAVEFYGDGTLSVTADFPPERPVADLVAGVLEPGAMNVKEIAAAIKEDTGKEITQDTVDKALRRHPDRFVVDGDKRPRRWKLT